MHHLRTGVVMLIYSSSVVQTSSVKWWGVVYLSQLSGVDIFGEVAFRRWVLQVCSVVWFIIPPRAVYISSLKRHSGAELSVVAEWCRRLFFVKWCRRFCGAMLTVLTLVAERYRRLVWIGSIRVADWSSNLLWSGVIVRLISRSWMMQKSFA